MIGRRPIAGVKYATVSIDSEIARIEPAIIGYAGGYYQWSNNWKLAGRAGIQSFGGANLGSLLRLASPNGLIGDSSEEPDAGKLHVRICEGCALQAR